MSSFVKTRRFTISTDDGPLDATVQIAVKIADGKNPETEGYGVSDEWFNRAASAALASIRFGRMIREVVGPLDGPNTYLEPVEPEGWPGGGPDEVDVAILSSWGDDHAE